MKFKVYYFDNRRDKEGNSLDRGVNISSSRMENYICFHPIRGEGEANIIKEELGLPLDVIYVDAFLYNRVFENPDNYYIANGANGKPTFIEIPEEDLSKEKEKNKKKIEISKIKSQLKIIDDKTIRPHRKILSNYVEAKKKAKKEGDKLLKEMNILEDTSIEDLTKIVELENEAKTLRNKIKTLEEEISNLE